VPNRPAETHDAAAWTKEVLPTRLTAIRESERKVLARLAELGYGEDHCFAVRLAFEEALINAMKHGNRMDPSRQVRLAYRISPERVEIRVADDGAGFHPECVPDPTVDENLQRPCGRGIMLMRSYMDEVTYSADGTEVRMVKHRGVPVRGFPESGRRG
jgi:serine/threonine-protein kinase RsbW